jgi:hypothetical protein
MKTKTKTKSKPVTLPVTLPAGVDQFLRPHLERELLIYTAGRVMTCPACGDILDCRRTTILSVHGVPAAAAAEKIIKTYVQCAACWDQRGAGSLASLRSLAAAKPCAKIRTELVDGRTVFADNDDDNA